MIADKEIKRLAMSIIMRDFAEVTHIWEELTKDIELVECYSDDNIVISAETKKPQGLFLIKYGEQYWTANNDLDYIIEKFTEKMVK